jgi:hypothetical protein
MRSSALAVTIAASVAFTAAPILTPTASAQSAQSTQSALPSVSVSTVLPVVLWAATGAVIGAVAWPVLVGNAAAPAGVMTLGAFVNTGAVAGTFLGGAGYLLTR